MSLTILVSRQLRPPSRLRPARKGIFSFQSPRVCQSCRISSSSRRATASAPSAPTPASSKPAIEKPYYVTTPIFYVNASPHVGHLFSMVLADIFKRWQVLKGKKAFLSTGTDEHGIKIQRAANEANMHPKEFCDTTSATFKDVAERINLANDHFVRTTDATHIDAVQYAWFVLEHNGYIYQSKHEGWYCVSDETYYPESATEKRIDPHTGHTLIASTETKKEVEWSSELNYHFKLSAFKDRLLEFYEKNPEFVVPATRMKDVVKWVSDGLEDLSISRPVERLRWGIPVPGDETQTIYVWLDALINYATKAGYPWAPRKEQELGWPADVHVIGKDIVRFHCIYWPAFLFALGLEPPKKILAHAHWTLGNEKMSKSTGNVVSPFLAIDRFGVDAIRYYLAHDGGIADDTDYGNDHIVERYRKGLQNGIGNLASRVMRTTAWKVRDSIKAVGDRVGDQGFEKDQINDAQYLYALPALADAKIDALDSGAALRIIMDAVYLTNKYFHQAAPWHMIKIPESDAEYHATKQRIEEVLYHCTESLRITAILLQPYMPSTMTQLLDLLGVHKDRRTFGDAVFGVDFEYGEPLPGNSEWFEKTRKRDGGLFPPLPVDT